MCSCHMVVDGELVEPTGGERMPEFGNWKRGYNPLPAVERVERGVAASA